MNLAGIISQTLLHMRQSLGVPDSTPMRFCCRGRRSSRVAVAGFKARKLRSRNSRPEPERELSQLAARRRPERRRKILLAFAMATRCGLGQAALRAQARSADWKSALRRSGSWIGRIARRLARKPATGFAGRLSEKFRGAPTQQPMSRRALERQFQFASATNIRRADG